jgi:putative FmdB family regulatory protein
MPIYEFKCSGCGKEFEKLCFASDQEDAKCPACGSADTQKVFSVFASTSLEKRLADACGSKHPGRS